MTRLPVMLGVSLSIVVLGLHVSEADAQVLQPPKQDCLQQAGIQPKSQGQDQSCNTVLKDPDLVAVGVAEQIQRLVDSSPSSADGPYVRVDLADLSDPARPFRYDYVTIDLSANNGNAQPISFTGGQIAAQIGFDPGVNIVGTYDIMNVSAGRKIVIQDNTTGNQIFGGCPDGVALIKNGGQNQTTTMIIDVDMWYKTDAGGEQCGLVFTNADTFNVVRLFYLAGPSGLFTTQNITDACADLNAFPGSQHAPVNHVRGGYPPTDDGAPPPVNLSGCSGFIASYCDFDEDEGLLNSCNPFALPLLGGAEAQPAVSVGAPFSPPGQGVAAAAVTTLGGGSDSTSTSFGSLSGGSLISGSPP